MKKRSNLVAAITIGALITAAIVYFANTRTVAPGTTSDATAKHEHAGEIGHYTCPMHPSVMQDAPGPCPICGMDLTLVTKEQVHSDTIKVDEDRRHKIGVRTTAAAIKSLTLEIRAMGEVHFDETKLSDVNLRMSGWVEKLFVDETGQRVKRGQTLFTLYSPELYAAQLEHLSAIKRSDQSLASIMKELKTASKQRLRLLGMSAAQIKRLENRGKAWENVPIAATTSGYVIEKNVVEGARVEPGMRLYRIADLSRVWIDAEVFENDAPHLKVDQSVRVELPYVQERSFEGRIDYIYPFLNDKTRTTRIRVVLPNKDLELKPDMYANVLLDVDLGKRLVVPDSAVVYTGPRRIVFVDVGEGRLRPTEVKLGVHAAEHYEILEGIDEGDLVVESGNFLLAAESRIRSVFENWDAGVDHGGH